MGDKVKAGKANEDPYLPLPAAGGLSIPQLSFDEETQTLSKDGQVIYSVFMPCGVSISVEEGIGHRKRLVLSLIDRAVLPVAERIG